jgi:polyisoprenoid-binding protein YceI
VDAEAFARTAVHVWVDLSSLDTGSRKRNDAILDTELFDIHWEPALVFDGEVARVDDRSLVLTGWLGLHALRERLSVWVELERPAVVGEEATELVATAHASIDRRVLGLRRRRGAGGWLSERLVGRTIEMDARIVATPAARALIPIEPPRFVMGGSPSHRRPASRAV